MPVGLQWQLFDVNGYHRTDETGTLPEVDCVAFIDGEVVAMTVIGPRHDAAVARANNAMFTAIAGRAIRVGRFVWAI